MASEITTRSSPKSADDQHADMDRQYEGFVREYSRSYHRLYSFILSLVGDVHQADDIMQEASLLLWQKFDDFAPGTDFLRWSRAFVRHLVMHLRRTQKQYRGIFDEALVAQLAATHVAADEWLETRRATLAGCVEKLPLPERRFLQRCYAEHGSIKTTAKELKKSQNAVSKRLARIRIKLSRCVARTLGLAEV